jgi:hypothetical protein
VHASYRRLFATLLFALLPCVTGCGASVTTVTTVAVKDPSRVALRDEAGRVVLPAGEAREVPLADVEVEPAPGGHTRVGLTAVRDAKGAIAIRWDTRLPLGTGEEQSLVLPSGTTALVLPESALNGPSFGQPLCAYVAERGMGGYAAVFATRDCGPHDLAGQRLTLDTPWDNVVVRRRTTVVSRTRQKLMGVGAAIVLVPLVIASSGASLTGAGGAAVLAGMGVMVGTGLAVVGAAFLFPPTRVYDETLVPVVGASGEVIAFRSASGPTGVGRPSEGRKLKADAKQNHSIPRS